MTDDNNGSRTCFDLMPRRVKPTHRETYPEQYAHPLVGARVIVRAQGSEAARGTVERVVQSRFGELVILEGEAKRAWALSDVERVR